MVPQLKHQLIDLISRKQVVVLQAIILHMLFKEHMKNMQALGTALAIYHNGNNNQLRKRVILKRV